MGQIVIDPSFFKNELRNYSDPKFSFWRELHQNSIDAGATKIDIGIDDEENEISFIDNGCGFSSKIRDDVYFNLGRTSKTGDSVGGFGKARIATCFAQRWYSIASHDWITNGVGSSYTVEDNVWTDGCKVKIGLIEDFNTADIRRSLILFLRLCHNPKCNIFVNGVQFSNWCYKRRHTKELSFGDIYVNKSGNFKNRLIVRVSGVAMFTRYISPDMQIVLEVNKKNSRDILLSNRDGMKSTFSNELDTFIQSLSVNTHEALRRNRRIFEVFGDKPKVTKREKKDSVSEVSVCTGIRSYEVKGNNLETDIESINTEENKVVCTKQVESRVDRYMEQIDDIIPSAVLVCDSYLDSIRKVAKKYNPNNWKHEGGGNREKLLKQWTIICEFAVREFLEHLNLEELSWRPGFYLSEEYKALHWKDGENIHSLFLNPVQDNGKLRYKLRSHDDWIVLMILASHEVAHVACEGHDEKFVLVSEALTERMMKNRKKVFASLLSSLKPTIKI